MKNELFDGLKAHLLRDGTFISKKGNIFKDEACMLVGLDRKKVDARIGVVDLFSVNMFKIRGFRNSMNFLKKDVHKHLSNLMKDYNITKSEISSSCKHEV